MKVAVLGGTGKMGMALAMRLAKNHQVIVGSRDPARAKEAAGGIEGATGTDYSGACRAADIIVFSIPYSAMGAASGLAKDAAGKLVISVINPMKAEGGVMEYGLDKGSAAEELAKLLPLSRVATAFNNVPSAFLRKESDTPIDILIAADTKATYEEAARLVREAGQMRPLYAGPLSQAAVIERITPLVLNLANMNGTGSLTTKFVSRKG